MSTKRKRYDDRDDLSKWLQGKTGESGTTSQTSQTTQTTQTTKPQTQQQTTTNTSPTSELEDWLKGKGGTTSGTTSGSTGTATYYRYMEEEQKRRKARQELDQRRTATYTGSNPVARIMDWGRTAVRNYADTTGLLDRADAEARADDLEFYTKMYRDATRSGSQKLADLAKKRYDETYAEYKQSEEQMIRKTTAYNDKRKADYEAWQQQYTPGEYYGTRMTEDEIAQRQRDIARTIQFQQHTVTDAETRAIISRSERIANRPGYEGPGYEAEMETVARETKRLTDLKEQQARYKAAMQYVQDKKREDAAAKYSIETMGKDAFYDKARAGKAKYEDDEKAAAARRTAAVQEQLAGGQEDFWLNSDEYRKIFNASGGFALAKDDDTDWGYYDITKFYAMYDDDPEQAKAWLEQTKRLRDEQEVQAYAYQYGQEWTGRVGAFVMSPAISLASGLDPYGSWGQKASRIAEGMQQGVTEGLTEHGLFDTGALAGEVEIPLLGKVNLGTFAGIGMSMVQSGMVALPAMAIGDEYTAIQKTVEFLGTALMGSSAAASDYREKLKAGWSETAAMTHSLWAGLAEAGFEYISLDKLVDQDVTRGIIRNFFTQGGVEASEEFCTTVANRISDEVLARKNGYNTAIEDRADKLMAEGYSYEGAMQQAKKEWITELINDAFAGFVSGGGMTAMHHAAASVEQAAATRSQRAEFAQTVQGTEGAVEAARKYAADRGLKAVKDSKGSTRQDARQGKGLQAVQEDITKRIEDAAKKGGVQGANQVYSEMVEKYGDGIRTLADAALDSAVSTAVTATTEGRRANAYSVLAHQETVEGIQDERAREVSKGAMERAVYSTMMDETDESAFRRGANYIRQNRGQMSMEVEVQSEEGTTKKAGVVSLTKDRKGVVLSDGSTVSLEKIQTDAESKDVLDVMAASKMTEQASAEMLDALASVRKDGSIDTRDWASDYIEAYDRGTVGVKSIDEAVTMAKNLPAKIASQAYQAGQRDAGEIPTAQRMQIEQIRKKVQPGATGRRGVFYADGVSEQTLNRLKNDKATGAEFRAQVEAMKLIAKATGVDIYLREMSEADEKGRLSGAQGSYKNGVIVIDVNAGLNNINRDLNRGLLAVTGHELTHWMKETAPEAFAEYRDAVRDALIRKVGSDAVDKLIDDQMASDTRLSREEALEEVVADAGMRFIADESFWGAVTESLGEDKHSIKHKIQKFFQDFFAKLREILGKTSQVGEAARIVDELEEAVQKSLGKLYAEGIRQASETWQQVGDVAMADAKGNIPAGEMSSNLDSPGHVVGNLEVDANGNINRNSIRTIPKTEAGWDKLIQDMVSAGFDQDQAKSWVQDMRSVAAAIFDAMQYDGWNPLDYESDPRSDWFRTNSGYPQGTIDFSNNCPRREEFTAQFDAAMKMLPNFEFDAQDYETLRGIIKDMGIPVPCGGCYVDERRQHLSRVGQMFIDQYRAALNGETKNALKPKFFSKVKAQDKSYNLTLDDLVSSDGLLKLFNEHRSLYDSFMAFNNNRGMQSIRMVFGLSEYKGQIRNWNTRTINRKNKFGGIRLFSYSDADPRIVLDFMQIVTDAAAKKLMMQGYTKKPWFAVLAKDTGLRILRSHIPLGVGFKTVNGQKVLSFDNFEGIDTRDKYYRAINRDTDLNVGNNVIGINDTQIRLAMVSDMIDQIIPFHTGLKGETLEQKGLGHWRNYKDFQEDKVWSDGGWQSTAKAKNHINLYEDVLNTIDWSQTETRPDGTTMTDAERFVNRYLEVCRERGFKPRFAQFLLDENGDYVEYDDDHYFELDKKTGKMRYADGAHYTYNPGYEKFLVDFRLFDKAGKIIPQVAVQPNFNTEFIREYFGEYVEDHKTRHELNKDVQKTFLAAMQSKYGDALEDGARRSSRITAEEDTEYLELAKAPKKNAARLQEMVDEAARRAGYDTGYLVWRGDSKPYNVLKTGAELDEENGDDYNDDHGNLGNGLYFTPDRSYAERFAGRGGVLRKFYLKSNMADLENADVRAIRAAIKQEIEDDFGDFSRDELYERLMEETGTDGIRAKGVGGFSGGAAREAIVRESWQAKLSDPVTYDDAGKPIPLSQRFDTENEDIRYSIRDSHGDVYRGITISDSDHSYSEDILSGKKKGETRMQRDPFLDNAAKTGERIALIRSGVKGRFSAYATARIGEAEWISADEWESRRNDTRVPKGSKYDIGNAEGKWYYPLLDVEALDEEIRPTTHSPKYGRFDTLDTTTAKGEEVRFSVRQEPAPKKTKTAYKLMRLVNGNLYPLFIGNNEEIHLGTWYDAESPNLTMLRNLPAGTHMLNMDTGEAITFQEYLDQYANGAKRKNPNVNDIHWANENGFRFMYIEDKAGTSSAGRMQKQYGDTRAYYNWGVNGNAKSETGEGSPSIYALRPGWHFGEVPSMHQIGYGDSKETRLDNQVWVEVEMSADVDYNEEARSNYSGDIPTHIPTNGYYTFATNPTQKKTKSGSTEADRTKADWYVAGAFVPVRILSDTEVDDIVRQYNARTGANVPLDHRRANGGMFNAQTMRVERSEARRSSRTNSKESDVFTTPRGVEVLKNPSDHDYEQFVDDIYERYPWMRNDDMPPVRVTYDEQGNEYYWCAYDAIHTSVEPYINERYDTRTSQQRRWWTREDKDDYPIDYKNNSGRYLYSTRDTSMPSDVDLIEGLDESKADTPEGKALVKDAKRSAGKLTELRKKLTEANKEARRLEGEVKKATKRGAQQIVAAVKQNQSLQKKLEDQIAREERILQGVLKPPAIQKMLSEAKRTAAAEARKAKDEVFARAKDRKRASELRSRIKNLSDEMKRRMTRPTDGAYVPASLYGSMTRLAEVLDEVLAPNPGTKAAERYKAVLDGIRRMSSEYAAVADLDDPVYSSEYDEEIKADIDAIERTLTRNEQTWLDQLTGDTQKRLPELSTAELQHIYELMKSINYSMKNAATSLSWNEGKSLYEAMRDVAAQQQELTPLEETGKFETSKRGRLLRKMSTMRAVEMMSGYQRDAALYQLMHGIEQGVVDADSWVMNYDKAMQPLKNGKNELEYRRAISKKLDFGATTDRGTKVLMTKMQAIQILMTAEREAHNDKLVHLQKGGAVIRDKSSGKSYTIQVTPELLSRIQDRMTDWDKAYMKTIREYFGREGKATNEILYKLKHRVLQTEEYYVPYQVDKNYLETKLDTPEAAMSMWVKTPGSTNALAQKASQPVYIDGMDAVMGHHVREIANYIGLALAIRDFSKVYNGMLSQGDGENPLPVKETIYRNFGADGQKILTQAVIDIQGGRRGNQHRTGIGKFLEAMQSSFYKTALLINPSVTIKQAASYVAIESILDHRAVIAGNRPIFVKADKSWSPSLIAHIFAAPSGATAMRLYNEIDAHTSMHYMRRQGMSMRELASQANRSGPIARAKGMVGASMEQAGWIGHKARQAAEAISPLNWIQRMDVATTAAIWVACKEQAKLDGMEVGTDEYWQHVTELYERCLRETQPMYDDLHRNEYQKDREGLMSYLFPFRTVPIQNHGQLANAFENMRAARKSGDKARMKAANRFFRKTVAAQTMSAAVFSVMTFLAAALKRKTKKYRDDDEEISAETIGIGIGKDVVGTLISVIAPLFGSTVWDTGNNVYDAVRTGNNIRSYDSFSVGVVDLLNDLESKTKDIATDVAGLIAGKDVDQSKFRDHVMAMVEAGAKCAGIPYTTIKTYSAGVRDNITDIMEGRIPALNDEAAERTNAVNAGRYWKAWVAGDDAKMGTVLDEMIQNYLDDGKDEEQAHELTRNALGGAVMDRYTDGELDLQELSDYMEGTGLWDDEKRQDKLAGIIRDELQAGLRDEDEAINLLTDLCGWDEDKAWKKAKEWSAKAEHADDEDFSYSQYDEIDAAIDANQDIGALVKELTDHGVKAESVRKHVKEYLTNRYVEGGVTETALKNQLSRYCGITVKKDVDEILKNTNSRKEFGVKYDDLDSEYRAGKITKTKMKSALMKYGGLDSDEADRKIRWYDLQKSNPNLTISEADCNRWYEGTKDHTQKYGHRSAKAEGMSIEKYVSAHDILDKVEKSSDKTREENYIQAISEITGLTGAQRWALYFEEYSGANWKKIAKPNW